jgi:hypothetical protein
MDSAQQQSTIEAKTVPQSKARSEVAAFIEQLDLEMLSIQQGLNGFATVAKHDTIIKRMSENIDEAKVDALWQAMRQEQNAPSADPTK